MTVVIRPYCKVHQGAIDDGTVRGVTLSACWCWCFVVFSGSFLGWEILVSLVSIRWIGTGARLHRASPPTSRPRLPNAKIMKIPSLLLCAALLAKGMNC